MKSTILTLFKTLALTALLFGCIELYATVPPGANQQETAAVQLEKGKVYAENLIWVFYAIAVLTGVIFLYFGATGWVKESKKGDHQGGSYKMPMVYIAIGSILCVFTVWVGIMSATASSEDVDENRIEQSAF